MMVQLTNPARLDKLIHFGKQDSSKMNQNGIPILGFVESFKAWGGVWQLTTTQLLQISGMNLSDNQIFVVRHRESWTDVIDAKIGTKVYHVKSIVPDVADTPTSYDLVTLEKVIKNG
ncbi:phage head closure protein [Lapidilactobacillus wuchangensis]|uniref:phage head closure protein n=1 Tax=Lapidilactobacillus wuchangensis TaxID=2486001 RepID=UPI001CDB90D2|nr:phage head closure protein [Lapidilactobacillus wuchangensis]